MGSGSLPRAENISGGEVINLDKFSLRDDEDRDLTIGFVKMEVVGDLETGFSRVVVMNI